MNSPSNLLEYCHFLLNEPVVETLEGEEENRQRESNSGNGQHNSDNVFLGSLINEDGG